MRENRLSGLMRGGKPTVFNPSLPAYSTQKPEAIEPSAGIGMGVHLMTGLVGR